MPAINQVLDTVMLKLVTNSATGNVTALVHVNKIIYADKQIVEVTTLI